MKQVPGIKRLFCLEVCIIQFIMGVSTLLNKFHSKPGYNSRSTVVIHCIKSKFSRLQLSNVCHAFLDRIVNHFTAASLFFLWQSDKYSSGQLHEIKYQDFNLLAINCRYKCVCSLCATSSNMSCILSFFFSVLDFPPGNGAFFIKFTHLSSDAVRARCTGRICC